MIDFPSNPANGDVFTFGNSSWVWNAAASQWRTAIVALNPKVQRLSGDGTTVQFTLNTTPPNTNFLDLYISGIYQQKNTYSISGTTLTFTEAPPSGTDNIEVEWGSTLDIGTPSDASVTAAKLTSTAITDKLGYTPLNKAGDTMTGNLTVPERIELFTDGVNGTQRHGRISATSSPNNPYAGGIKLEYFNFNGTSYQFYDGLSVDGAGRVRMPNQPAFFAYGLPSNLYANYGAGAITFANTTLNTSNSWNGSRFTAPVAGTYLFFFDAMYTHRGGDFALQVWKNGAAVAYNNAYGRDNVGNYEQWTSSTTSWVGTMAANDYIDFRYSSSGDTSTYLYAGGVYTKCYGYMIG